MFQQNKNVRFKNCLWRRNVIWGENFAPVIVDVEAGPVASVLPTFRAQFDGGANLLEIAGNVQHSHHTRKSLQKKHA